LFRRLSRRADRQHASMKEMTGSVLAKIQYHSKEREIQFQNRWTQVSISFYFTGSKYA
jgi:hypothetical protein